MHTKLALVLAVLAIVTGSGSAARAAAAPAAVPGAARAPRPAAMLGRGETGATIGAAAPQRRVAHDQGPRNEGDQRSRPYRATPATGSGTMIQPPQPRRPDVPAIPVTAYVVNAGSGTVTPITTATNTAGHPITTGSDPWAIAITPDGATAYVANEHSGTVTPIATATNTAGPPITVGSAPWAIAITITPPAAASHEIKGYGGKCADDTGNSSAVLAKVQIWSCVNDASQQWSFTGGELKHGSLCMNDQGNAGNGGHVILWSCNGASNEVWEHTSSGEYMLKSNGLCLDDPADSTRNGTQLDVYRCHNGSNEVFSARVNPAFQS
jgi:YVTN family beta-propeller protein